MQAALNLDGEPMGNSSMKVQQSRTPIMNAGWRAPVSVQALFLLVALYLPICGCMNSLVVCDSVVIANERVNTCVVHSMLA